MANKPCKNNFIEYASRILIHYLMCKFHNAQILKGLRLFVQWFSTLSPIKFELNISLTQSCIQTLSLLFIYEHTHLL